MKVLDFFLRGKTEPIEINLPHNTRETMRNRVWGILFYQSVDLSISGEAKSGYPEIKKICIEKGNTKRGIHILRDWNNLNKLIKMTQEKANSALGALMTGEIWIDPENIKDAVDIAMMMADDIYQFHTPTWVGDADGKTVFQHCICNKKTAKKLMRQTRFSEKKKNENAPQKSQKNRRIYSWMVGTWEKILAIPHPLYQGLNRIMCNNL